MIHFTLKKVKPLEKYNSKKEIGYLLSVGHIIANSVTFDTILAHNAHMHNNCML